ncbi:hypothetical protein Tco_0443409, partial [Tanacetum coccineum]
STYVVTMPYHVSYKLQNPQAIRIIMGVVGWTTEGRETDDPFQGYAMEIFRCCQDAKILEIITQSNDVNNKISLTKDDLEVGEDRNEKDTKAMFCVLELELDIPLTSGPYTLRSRTHKLKRLYKVGLTARVESFGDEEDLGEDASKQGRRINAIDSDEDITLVDVQDEADNEMFNVNVLNGEEVFVAGQNENVVEEVVDAAQGSTAATTVIITIEEITLAQVLEALKTSKPKVKGIVFQEPSTTTITTISSQQSHDKGKGIMIEEPVKPMKKKYQISFVPPHNSMCVPLR